MMKHLSGNDACNEVIHDYQLSEINDCHEAYTNAALDIVLGYYCGATKSTADTCAPGARRPSTMYHNITLRRFTSRGARAFLLYSSSISRR